MTDQRLAFAKRLSEILGLLGVARGRGEQTALGRLFRVSQQAARQWLTGETMPDEDTIHAMARKAAVNYEWLRWGKGQKLVDIRPKLKDLLRVAEPLKDYQIDQLIKIVPALTQRPEPLSEDDAQDEDRRRRNG